MGKKMIGVGAIPTGKGVGRKAGVHQGDSALHRRVAQFGVVPVNLRRCEHPLVDYGPGGETADVPLLVNSGTPNLVGCPLVDDVELAIESLLISAVERALEEQLPYLRFCLLSGIPQRRAVG